MARTSQRLSAGITNHKRNISDNAATDKDTKKSKLARDETQTDPDDSATSEEDELSEFESEADPSDADSSGDGDMDYSEDDRPRSKKTTARRTSAKTTPTARVVSSTDQNVKLKAGEVRITEIPKARPAGKIPFEDHTLHPNTFLFLKDLKSNNDRPWLKCE